MMNLNPVERRPRCKRRKQTGHYEKTCAGGVVGSNPKVPKDITFVDGDTYTTYESGPSKRNEKDAKLVHGSFAGQSIRVLKVERIPNLIPKDVLVNLLSKVLQGLLRKVQRERLKQMLNLLKSPVSTRISNSSVILEALFEVL